MRVKLGETRPPAESLDDLPDPVVGHTTLLPVASAAAVTHHKHRILTATTNPLLREVFGHHDFRHLGEGDGRLVPALATHTPQTELRRVVADVEADHLGPPQAATGHERDDRPLTETGRLREQPLDRLPARDPRQAGLPAGASNEIERVLVELLAAHRPLAEAAEGRDVLIPSDTGSHRFTRYDKPGSVPSSSSLTLSQGGYEEVEPITSRGYVIQ